MEEKLSKEQYEKLTPYKDALRSAVRNSFVHVTSTEFQKIADIYNEIYSPLRKNQMGCNTCRLNALRKLGELYAAYTEDEEEKKVKKERAKKLQKEPKEE